MRYLVFSTALVAFTLTVAAADDKGNPLSEPKKSIEHQLKLLKEGNAEKLKECFTKRQQDKVTPDTVKGAQKQLNKMTVDDLVKTVAVSEAGGVKSAKITMKNGRTLTTLVLTDGRWLADTIWFK